MSLLTLMTRHSLPFEFYVGPNEKTLLLLLPPAEQNGIAVNFLPHRIFLQQWRDFPPLSSFFCRFGGSLGPCEVNRLDRLTGTGSVLL